MKLVSKTLIKNIQEDFKPILEELDDMYILARYPEDFDAMEAKLTPEKVSKIFEQVKGLYNLLERNLK